MSIPTYDRIRSMSGILKFHLSFYPYSRKLHKRTLALYGDTLDSFTVTRLNGMLYFFRIGGKQERNVWYVTPIGAINPLHNDHPDFISIYSSYYATHSNPGELLPGQDLPQLVSPQ